MPEPARCGAKTRSGGACRAWAMPNGRCKMHGGTNTGAPKGNKNALKTGEHETIFADALEDDELALFRRVDVDRLSQVDEQIRLTVIRMRRMMMRIANLAGVDFTVVEESVKAGAGVPMETTEKSRATLGQIQDIEEALTRVQAQHTRLISQKHQILSAEPDDDDEDVSGYEDALTEAAQRLEWPLSAEDE